MLLKEQGKKRTISSSLATSKQAPLCWYQDITLGYEIF